MVNERVRNYNDAVLAFCTRLGTPAFDPAQATLSEGVPYTMGPDALHADLATRRASARAAARYLAQTLASTRSP
jgi:hypothetical protein